ncbi:hypothetical protein Ptr902_05755 [Pyrenophora tritici-repentis]|nr:hypothetical protein Ptr902_05755 [Pyrenophora tritici-repentis]
MALHDLVQYITTSPTLALLYGLAVFLPIYAVVHTFVIRPLPANAPQEIRDNYPISGAWGFWMRRWDWYRQRISQSQTGHFSFHVGSHPVVALSGDSGRQLNFESKDLGFAAGYAVLFGQTPAVDKYDDGHGRDHDVDNQFNRRLISLLKTEHFRRKLPTLISDVQEAIEAIQRDPSGITNPFESLYRVVFRFTIRMVGADEIGDDLEVLDEMLELFEMLENSATATAVMFPKFPSPAILKRTYAGGRLYMLIENIIKKRAASDETHDDALQYMIDQGDRTFMIVKFIVGALFAGILNSGINAAWVMCYLASSPEWLAKTQEEVRNTAAKYARDPNAPLRYQLNDVPLDAWEAEFPIIDMCLRDSIRLNLLGTTFRKNTSGRAIPIGDSKEVIPPDAFVVYAAGDIHLNPEVYPNPYEWDPARYTPERAEDKRKLHGFLGWGAGRHPCLGMRFAKLEQNIITAYFIASFDFHLCDKSGNLVLDAPRVDFNRHSAHKPKNPPYLKVTPKEK